ncbi:MAG: NAD(P)-dependent alcohol dehydrogenase [Clostridiales Family XIII bacterium]|jgi:aryl-alcohol dehydrogenase|nr:NAD(P)-dependent alcohol dehydrogenase [Clostridiales Family XIII bacterium]
MKITAAITRTKGEISIEEAELAAPKASEVLVKIIASGVCHTDAAGIEGFIPWITFPQVFGHEGVGIVEEVGIAVDTLKPGDRVAMTFPSCGRCKYCLDGHPYACVHLNELFFSGAYKDGTRRISQNGEDIGSFFAQGAFATHAIVDARNAVKVEGIPDDKLKYLCSLGCGVQTGAGAVLNRCKPKPATSLVVFGSGGVGMAAVMAAAIAGCTQIIAVDVVPSRLEMAKEFGATDTINAKEVDDVVAKIKEITGGGAHYSIESSGIPALTLQATACLRRMGIAVICSVTGPAEVSIPLEMYLMNPSVTLAGLTEGGSNPQIFIPKLAEYFKAGRLPVDRLVKFYDFKDIKQAFADSHSGVTVKPILLFD